MRALKGKNTYVMRYRSKVLKLRVYMKQNIKKGDCLRQIKII